MRTHWNRQSPPQLPKPLLLSREQVLSKPDFREAKHTSKERFSWGRTALGALSLVGVSSGILAGSVSEAVNVDLPAQTSDSGVDLNHQKECSLVLWITLSPPTQMIRCLTVTKFREQRSF